VGAVFLSSVKGAERKVWMSTEEEPAISEQREKGKKKPIFSRVISDQGKSRAKKKKGELLPSRRETK